MKKLMIVLGLMLGLIVMNSCGGSSVSPGMNFFEEYYSGCIDYCQADINWLRNCKPKNPYFKDTQIPDLEECVMTHWLCDMNIPTCISRLEKIPTTYDDCNEYIQFPESRCFGIPENCRQNYWPDYDPNHTCETSH